MALSIKKAKSNLLDILQDEWSNKGSALDSLESVRERSCQGHIAIDSHNRLNDKIHFIRKNSPHIRAVGTNQIVLDAQGGFLVKAPLEKVYAVKSGFEESPKPQYHLVPFTLDDHYVVYSGFETHVPNNISHFREIGCRVLPHRFTEVERTNGLTRYCDGARFAFVPDLEGVYFGGVNRQVVSEVNHESLSGLANGHELTREFESHLDHLTRIYQGTFGRGPKVGQYKLQISGHKSVSGPQEALRRLFFLCVNPAEDVGKLIVGDIDHVLLYKWD